MPVTLFDAFVNRRLSKSKLVHSLCTQECVSRNGMQASQGLLGCEFFSCLVSLSYDVSILEPVLSARQLILLWSERLQATNGNAWKCQFSLHR